MCVRIAFAINNDYAAQLAVLLLSIMEHASKNDDYFFYTLHSDLSSETIGLLSKIVKERHNNATIKFINIKDKFSKIDIEKYLYRTKKYNYISKETYFRFFLPDIFPTFDKVLYIDSDCLAFDDISKLYNESVDGFWAAAVQDNWQSYLIERKALCPVLYKFSSYSDYYKRKLRKNNLMYFNAGVILFNLSEMRKDRISSVLWKIAEEGSPFIYQDQDILNSVLEQKVRYLGYRWNICKDIMLLINLYKDRDLARIIKDECLSPGIIHFSGSNKPWLDSSGIHDYGYIEDWWKYYRLTPFYRPDDEKVYIRIHREIGSMRHLIVKAVKRIYFYMGKEFFSIVKHKAETFKNPRKG